MRVPAHTIDAILMHRRRTLALAVVSRVSLRCGFLFVPLFSVWLAAGLCGAAPAAVSGIQTRRLVSPAEATVVSR